LKSHIVITNDFEALREELEREKKRLVVFEREEFKVEDAKEVIEEAYIREEKILLLIAKKFNIYAQNALLKVLEEPPPGVTFVLASPSKAIFLPTILSRLMVVVREKSESEIKEIRELSLNTIYSLAKEKLTKEEAKAVLKGLIKFGLDRDYTFSQKELEQFERALYLLELNSNPNNILIGVGLILLEKGSSGDKTG